MVFRNRRFLRVIVVLLVVFSWGQAAGVQVDSASVEERVSNQSTFGLLPGAVDDVPMSRTSAVVASSESQELWEWGNSSHCRITAAGGVECRGTNFQYSLGVGDDVPSHFEWRSVCAPGASTPCTDDLMSGVSAISGGSEQYCAVLEPDGNVACWGWNLNGKHGNGTSTQPTVVPTLVVECLRVLHDGCDTPFDEDPSMYTPLTGATSISVGSYGSCALIDGGSAKCWGTANLVQGANTGAGSSYYKLRATEVCKSGSFNSTCNPFDDLVDIQQGQIHTCALSRDGGGFGRAYCFGLQRTAGGYEYNERSINPANPGSESGVFYYTPQLIDLGESVVSLAVSGGHNCALLESKIVKCWGVNQNGQVGTGTSTASANISTVQTEVGNLEDVRMLATARIAAANTNTWATKGHTCAIVGDAGAVWCWGANNLGQLGDGTTVDRPYATQMRFRDGTLLTGATDMRLFIGGTCVLVDGTRFCNGQNDKTDQYKHQNAFGLGDGAWVGTPDGGGDKFHPFPVPVLTAPGTPDVTVEIGDGQATLSWPDVDDGGASFYGPDASTPSVTAALSYSVEYSEVQVGPTSRAGLNRSGAIGTAEAASCPASPCVITGLDNGTTYSFTVSATNGTGTSPAASDPVTPHVPPGAPTTVSAVEGDREAVVSWQAPAELGDPAASEFVVTATPDDGSSVVVVSCVGSPCTVEGLTGGVSYTFAVAAKSSAATSAASLSSDAVTVYETPGVPSGVTGVAGVGEVEVSWVAPSSLGLPAASEFVVTATPDDGSSVVVVSCVGSPCTVDGLGEGVSYTFAVGAKSSVATSAASAPSDAVTVLTAPGAPTGVSAVAGVGEAVVSWVAPAELGDPALSSYVVTASPGGAQCTVDASSLSCTVEGLTGGVSYTFAVTAKSSVATSAASASSDAVTISIRQTPEGPIYEPDGSTPELAPGDVVVRESAELSVVASDAAGSEGFSLGDGSEIGAQLLRDDRELVLEPVGDVGDADFEVRLSADCGGSACEVETGTDPSGDERHVLRLNAEGGSAQLSGEGFLPGSTVRLWIFSDPTFVTEVQVADDGTFVGSAPLVALPNGDHTVQVNGVSFDGLYRSATVGVRLDDETDIELPSTGAGNKLVPIIILVLAIGALGLLVQRPSDQRRVFIRGGR